MGLNTGGPEVVCEADHNGIITSGGGFSTFFATPSWQQAAVSKYFATAQQNGVAPSSGYNPNGRAYPDISFIGANYAVMIAGNLYGLYGTSCSAPVFAAMVSLVNSARHAQGLGSIG